MLNVIEAGTQTFEATTPFQIAASVSKSIKLGMEANKIEYLKGKLTTFQKLHGSSLPAL